MSLWIESAARSLVELWINKEKAFSQRRRTNTAERKREREIGIEGELEEPTKRLPLLLALALFTWPKSNNYLSATVRVNAIASG